MIQKDLAIHYIDQKNSVSTFCIHFQPVTLGQPRYFLCPGNTELENQEVFRHPRAVKKKPLGKCLPLMIWAQNGVRLFLPPSKSKLFWPRELDSNCADYKAKTTVIIFGCEMILYFVLFLSSSDSSTSECVYPIKSCIFLGFSMMNIKNFASFCLIAVGRPWCKGNFVISSKPSLEMLFS